MKRFLATLCLIVAAATTSFGQAKFGRLPWMISVGYPLTAAETTFVLDSNFVFGTSGDAYGAVIPGRAQTSGALTVYVYCTADAGVPDLTQGHIYATATGANDTDRPDAGSSPIASSSAVDADGCPKWLTYTFTVTLVASAYYWFVVENDEAAPATDSFTLSTRARLIRDSASAGTTVSHARSATTTDGFTTDPIIASTGSAIVVKYNNGALWGNPFVGASAHSSTTDYRGMRCTFDEDVTVTGFFWGFISAALSTFKIYTGVTEVLSVTLDEYGQLEASSVSFSPITLTGGTAYDFVVNVGVSGTAGTIGTIGTSPPADVQNAIQGCVHVEGATAGSFTATATQIFMGAIYLDNNPAITGGGGGSYTFVQ